MLLLHAIDCVFDSTEHESTPKRMSGYHLLLSLRVTGFRAR